MQILAKNELNTNPQNFHCDLEHYFYAVEEKQIDNSNGRVEANRIQKYGQKPREGDQIVKAKCN